MSVRLIAVMLIVLIAFIVGILTMFWLVGWGYGVEGGTQAAYQCITTATC